MSLRLSVLDQSPVSQGSTGADALHNSVDLARLTEQLGYTRYWVAEHHGTPMLACASPEVLIAAIGSATSRIRVGSGGVMLPHYSPLKVAETFSMLSGLYGERVDLAVGRAPGSDPVTAFALQRDRRTAAPDDFPEQLAELLAYVHDRMPVTHRFARLAKLPGGTIRPDIWLLGSSPQSGLWAADLGLPYAFADFINPAGVEIARRYRQDLHAVSDASGAARDRGHLGALRGHRRGRAASRRQQPHGLHAVSAGPADSSAARQHGARVHRSSIRRRSKRWGNGADGSSDRLRRYGRESNRWRRSTALTR